MLGVLSCLKMTSNVTRRFPNVDDIHRDARLALLMGVAPEAMVGCLLPGIGSKVSISYINDYKPFYNLKFIPLDNFLFSSGARPALPMGVAPETMVGCLLLIIGSKMLVMSRICTTVELFVEVDNFMPMFFALCL